jgi:hypothetical protein
VAFSEDGVLFRFPGLAEGDSTTIEMDLKIPDVTGPVANAVVAYDGNEPDRAKGVRLETQVER